MHAYLSIFNFSNAIKAFKELRMKISFLLLFYLTEIAIKYLGCDKEILVIVQTEVV